MTQFFAPLGAEPGTSFYDFARLRVTQDRTSGIINLTTKRYQQRIGSDKTWVSKPLPTNMKLVVYLAGESFKPKPISPVLTTPYTVVLDSTQYPDGMYSVFVVLVDCPDAHKYRSIGGRIKINNSGQIDQVGKVPSYGLQNRGQNFDSPIADWVTIPQGRPKHTVTNYPPVIAPPAHTLPDPAVMHASEKWIVEPIAQNSSGLYQGTLTWYRDDDGWPYIDLCYPHTQPELEQATDRAFLNDFYDGPRNNSSRNPYSTLAFCKFSEKLMGLGVMGDFWEMNPDGSSTTLWGPRGDPNEIPVRHSAAFYSQHVGVSLCEEISFDCCIDFTQSLTRPGIWFIADMHGGRIIQIDIGKSPAEASVYVKDIPRVASLFALGDGTLIASQMPTAGGGEGEGPKGLIVIDPNKNIRHLNINLPGLDTPMCVRPTSDGKIIIADQVSHHIYEIDPLTNASRLVASPYPQPSDAQPGQFIPTQIPQQGSVAGHNWSWLDVDAHGTCGYEDDIFYVAYIGGGNNLAVRIPRWNTSKSPARPIQPTSKGMCRVGAAEYAHEYTGHYPWAVAISPHEARAAFYGTGGDGLLMIRGRVATDPPASFDLRAYNLGRSVFTWGTIEGFPFGIRPSFTALYNPYGHQKLGLKTFDELAAMDDTTLAKYIQDGLGGTVARPEIVGYPLACCMYFIRCNSIERLARVIPIPVKPIDKTFPLISNVQLAVNTEQSAASVTWTTNEPTLGYVAFGSSAHYHRWSEPEAEFGLVHKALLVHLPSNAQFSIRCADLAGNVTFGPGTILI
jgi:hypothetical protein